MPSGTLPRGPLRRALGVAGASVGTLALLALVAGPSRWRSPGAGDHALLRLTWQLPNGFVERCAAIEASELRNVPAGGRTITRCRDEFVNYRLTVVVDGTERLDELLVPGGMKRDYPPVVLRDLPVAPGQHTLSVRYEPDVDADLRARLGEGTAPSFAGTLDLPPGGICRIELDSTAPSGLGAVCP